MLRTIILKELLENLESYKFVILIVSCFILIGFSNYEMYKNYKNNVEDYSLQSANGGDILIRKPPSVLSIYVNGVQAMLERTFMFQKGYYEPMETSLGFNLNFFKELFPVLDFAYVVKAVLSFLMMIVGFDLLCGEKLRGTLRLILANSVSRNTIILGKIIGNFITLVIPFMFAFLVFYILFQFMPDVSFSVEDHLRLLIIVFVSLLYLLIFLLAAIIVSGLVHSPKSSIIACFLVWVSLVFLLPNILSLLAKKSEHVPNEYKIMEEKKYAYDEFTKVPGQHSKEWVVQQTMEKFRKLSMDFRNKLFAYTSLAKLLNRVTPTGAFILFSTNLAKYGLDDEHEFRKAIFQYVQDYQSNPTEKTAFSFKGSTLTQSLQNGIYDLFSLLFFAVLFYLGAFTAFLRYDVR